MAAFVLMYFIGAHSIRAHNDTWLRGEGAVLHQVSLAAPPGASHAGVMRAIAASASREVTSRTDRDEMIFFLEMPRAGGNIIWSGPHPQEPFVAAIQAASLPTGKPRTCRFPDTSRRSGSSVRRPVRAISISVSPTSTPCV